MATVCARAAFTAGAVLLVVARGVSAGTIGPSVVSVGTFPDGSYSLAYSVTDDGQVVTGTGQSSGGVRAFRWDAAGGLLPLGTTPGFASSVAQATSADGSVVAGYMYNGTTQSGHGFRWTAATGIVDLGVAWEVYDTDRTGSTIVGWNGTSGVRWTQLTGMQPLTGMTTARAVSGDGSIVVGAGASRPRRWTEAGGAQDIPLPAGFTGGTAFGINRDATAIVGQMTSAALTRSFLWTQLGGATDLGTIAGATYSNYAAVRVSDDGRVVIGRASGATNGAAPTTWVWTPDSGMRRLRDVIIGLGGDASGWTFLEPFDLSPDGTTVVGWGGFGGGFEGYRASIAGIPAPGGAGLLGLAGLWAARRRRA